MNIKRYKISYDWSFDMVVEIDHDIMTDEKLHEINNFWSDAEERYERADDNIIKAVLMMLAAKAFGMTFSHWDVAGAFDWKKGRGEEGWPSMDGSDGIKIVYIDDIEFDTENFSFKEITEQKGAA